MPLRSLLQSEWRLPYPIRNDRFSDICGSSVLYLCPGVDHDTAFTSNGGDAIMKMSLGKINHESLEAPEREDGSRPSGPRDFKSIKGVFMEHANELNGTAARRVHDPSPMSGVRFTGDGEHILLHATSEIGRYSTPVVSRRHLRRPGPETRYSSTLRVSLAASSPAADSARD